MNSDLNKMRLRFFSDMGGLLNTLQISVEEKDIKSFNRCREAINQLLDDFLFLNKSILLEDHRLSEFTLK